MKNASRLLPALLIAAALASPSGCSGKCDCGAPGAFSFLGREPSKLTGAWVPDVDSTFDPTLFALKNRRMEMLRQAAGAWRLIFEGDEVTVRMELPPEAVQKARRPRLIQAAVKGLTLPYKLLEETDSTARIEVQRRAPSGAAMTFNIKFVNPDRITVERADAAQRIPPVFLNRVKNAQK